MQTGSARDSFPAGRVRGPSHRNPATPVWRVRPDSGTMRPMSPQEWLGLALRWVHLIAGIAWIGSSFYFIWLDAHLEPADPARADADVEGSLWMVHSGGFYRVERRKIGPGRMPAILHWFKWEAFFTGLTGVALLTLVYYTTHGIYLTDPAVSSIRPGPAALLGGTLLVAGW